MSRILVNDMLSALPDHRTFWHDLQDWFGMDFIGGDYNALAAIADTATNGARLIIRNATWFGPLNTSRSIPTISLLQDIFADGPQRAVQDAVVSTSNAVVFNSAFTAKHYTVDGPERCVIHLPVDFTLFRPGNPMGLQQALSLPSGAVAWVGAHEGPAGQVKGWDIFLTLVRFNPDIPFVAVFKDSIPASLPPNLRAYARLTHAELVPILGACRMGICTSRTESQHLAGIEMGACGLPVVAPPVGIYWKREEFPGIVVEDPSPAAYSSALRQLRFSTFDPDAIRAHWMKDCHPEITRLAWTALVARTENPHD